MSNGSPTAFLSWAILSSLFLTFLLYHLWSYDRLQCIKWNAGRQPGAFRRLMTYSYLCSTPLLILFSSGICALKFKQGFLVMSPNEVIPMPPDMWSMKDQHVLLALYFVFSVGWALEQVTHFEELAFWLFLLDQGPEKRDWFTSWEYKLWSTSCVVAILGMPITTLASRHNILTIDAWIFLVGALSSSTTNVIFIYVLFRFPRFLRHVKAEGAAPEVVVRLATFYELNLVRIVFRFVASLPLLVLAVDGIHGSHVINRSLFWSDILLILSAIGQVISSLITVMVFFPRSVTNESGYRPRVASNVAPIQTEADGFVSPEIASMHMQIHSNLTSMPGSSKSVSVSGEVTPSPPPPFTRHAYTRSSSDIPVELVMPPPESRRTTLPESVLHHFVKTFTSPIDLIDMPPNDAP